MLRAVMSERGVSFKAALNEAIRGGLDVGGAPGRDFRVQARPMGVRPNMDLDKALSLAGEMEDAEILRKLALRK